MTLSLAPTALVLVAVMPEPRDLEIARVLGWYRIPLRSAPKVIDVDALAFYQPGSFGARKWRVEVAARVRGHELTTRAALLADELDHPRAHEEYFKIQLGPLIALPSPILAGRWKRLTFLYTTGERLLSARYLQDLVVRSEERAVLWHALRERALAARPYQATSLPGKDLGQEVLAMLLGIQALETGDVEEAGDAERDGDASGHANHTGAGVSPAREDSNQGADG